MLIRILALQLSGSFSYCFQSSISFYQDAAEWETNQKEEKSKESFADVSVASRETEATNRSFELLLRGIDRVTANTFVMRELRFLSLRNRRGFVFLLGTAARGQTLTVWMEMEKKCDGPETGLPRRGCLLRRFISSPLQHSPRANACKNVRDSREFLCVDITYAD